MRRMVVAFLTAGFVVGLCAYGQAGEISPAMQAELNRHMAAVKEWAADAAVVKAVVEQNAKGPIAGMDNAKWKTVRRSDPLVKGFQSNPAGEYLRRKLDESKGLYSEAFLSAAKGEKVAFAEKTTSYIHRGQAKFDVPFDGNTSWQGKAEFDESSQSHQVQVSVPVVSGGRPIGALVVGVNLTQLEKLAAK